MKLEDNNNYQVLNGKTKVKNGKREPHPKSEVQETPKRRRHKVSNVHESESSHLSSITTSSNSENEEEKSDDVTVSSLRKRWFKYYNQYDGYWNVFSKTDYVYSKFSPHKWRLVAPGVPMIPNMSRPSIPKQSYQRNLSQEWEYQNYINRKNQSLPERLRDTGKSLVWQVYRVIVSTILVVTTTTTTTTTSSTSYSSSQDAKGGGLGKGKIFKGLLALLLLLLAFFFCRNIFSFGESNQTDETLLLQPFQKLADSLWGSFCFLGSSLGMIPTLLEQVISLLGQALLCPIYLFGAFLNATQRSESFMLAGQSGRPTSISEDGLEPLMRKVLQEMLDQRKEKGDWESIKEKINLLVQESLEKNQEKVREHILRESQNVEKRIAEETDSRSQELRTNILNFITNNHYTVTKEQVEKLIVDNVMSSALELETKIKEEISLLSGNVEGHVSGTRLELEKNLKETTDAFGEKLKRWQERVQSLESSSMTQQTQLLSNNERLSKVEEMWKENELSVRSTVHDSEVGPVIRWKDVQKYVHKVISEYHADRVGMPDFALQTGGGVVLNIGCTTPHTLSEKKYYLFNFPLWNVDNGPDTILKPGIMPGECWAFAGSEGYVVIKLAATIKVTAVTMEHMPKELSIHGHIKSAPYQFSVLGRKHEYDLDPVHLGTFKFLDNGESLQTFSTIQSDQVFDIIELIIESNHGHPEYTCLYRFRVHGIPASAPAVESEKDVVKAR